jgi:hypothetical protein
VFNVSHDSSLRWVAAPLPVLVQDEGAQHDGATKEYEGLRFLGRSHPGPGHAEQDLQEAEQGHFRGLKDSRHAHSQQAGNRQLKYAEEPQPPKVRNGNVQWI